MHSLGLKKLISFFLIFSALASSGVFALEKYMGEDGGKNAFLFLNGAPGVSSNGTYPSINSLASSENVPSIGFVNPQGVDANGLPLPPNSSNLTANLSRNLVRALLITNPEGPTNTSKDSLGLSFPSTKLIDDSINGAVTERVKNEFDFVNTASKVSVFVQKDDGVKEKAEYMKKAAQIIGASVEAPEFETLVLGTQNLQVVKTSDETYARVVAELQKLPVPPSFEKTHRALLALYINQKKLLDIGERFEEDPLKTVVAMQNANTIIGNDTKRVADELYDQVVAMSSDTGRNTTASGIESFFQGIFGIQKAHAVSLSLGNIGNLGNSVCGSLSNLLNNITDGFDFGGGGIGSIGGAGGDRVPILMEGDETWDTFRNAETRATNGSCIQKVYEWLMQMANDLIRDRLMATLQEDVLGWVQGNGDPQFVTNWQGYLSNIFSGTAQSVLGEISGGFCNRFRNPVRNITLNTVAAPNIDQIIQDNTQCTYPDAGPAGLPSISRFSSDFRTGGWRAYMRVLQPENNVLGATYLAQQAAAMEASAAQSAANAELNAGEGFEPTRQCLEEAPGPTQPGQPRPCLRWGPVNTPGGTISDILDQTLGAPIQRITNADNLNGLAGLAQAFFSQIANAALDRISQSGFRGLRLTNF